MIPPLSPMETSPGGGAAAWTSWRVTAPLLMLGALGVMVSAILWPQWRHNPEFFHGLFMPVLFAVLLYESRRHGTRRLLPDSQALSVTMIALMGIGLLIFSAGGLYALALGWSHDIPCLAAALEFSAFGLATLIALSRRSVGLWWFNWPALAAFGLWTLCAPLPPGLWARLMWKLQMGVTTAVLDTLHILGIPAVQQGNIIELARTSVGVEEAGYGVRSLVSCLFAGVFLSASMVRHSSSRLILIALSAPLAVALNYIRSLLLNLLANKGVDISGSWHDITGFAILGATAIILAAFAIILARVEKFGARRTRSPEQAVDASAPKGSLIALTCGLGLAVSIALIFIVASKPVTGIKRAAPDLEAILPSMTQGWQVISAPDPLRFSEVLQTDRLIQRDYVRVDADGTTQVTVYLAYWAPGQSNPSRVAIHTSDGCWPGDGWSLLPLEPAQAR
ncbi:MAG: exosortase/archaeosortase family protein [Opitutaceae bacterium]|jgi:exosortase